MEEAFRTTEISDPKFKSDNLRFITVKSNNLKGRGDICVFVPPIENAENLPIIILLHGVYGSAWVWAQKAGVHLTAWDMMKKGIIKPMVIAMPSDGLWGDGSGYLPHNQKNFEKWIVEDVPLAVSQNVPIVSLASDLFISGLSMGGFGALRLGIKYAKKFKAISAHSAITDIDQMPLFVEEATENYKQLSEAENSVIGMVKSEKADLPRIRFDCGLQDDLLEANRTLHRQLQEFKIEHIYQEFKGAHEWSYWQEHVAKTLRFFDAEK